MSLGIECKSVCKREPVPDTLLGLRYVITVLGVENVIVATLHLWQKTAVVNFSF